MKDLKEIIKLFEHYRVFGCVGVTNSGKTNNLVFLVSELKKFNPDLSIVVYGFNKEVTDYLVGLGCRNVDSLKQLSLVRDSVIFVDEFQKLKISDRRYKSLSDEFFDFIYHNNNWVILSSPNLSEFNKMVCRRVKVWFVKNLSIDDLVNGSSLKSALNDYMGVYKSLGRFNISKSSFLVLCDEQNFLFDCDYVKMVDSKKDNRFIFVGEKVDMKKSKKNVGDIVKNDKTSHNNNV